MIERMKASKGGFTLVELIVVIAILGILAGISVPVYSGYIDKAGEASDLQLLSAVNTAFSAACAEIGLDPTGIVGIASMGDDNGSKGKVISSISAVGESVDADKQSALNDSFFLFYGDNKTTPFKKFESLGYDRQNGVFVDGAKEYSYETEYGTVTITAAQLTSYQASTFAALGSQKLTGTIGTLVGDVLTSETSILANGQLKSFITDTLNLDYDGMSPAQKANALVLFAASRSGSDYLADLQSRLASGNVTQTTTDAGDSVAEWSARYAMAVAYASTGGDVSVKSFDPAAFKSGTVSNIGNSGWKKLYGTEDIDEAVKLAQKAYEDQGNFEVKVGKTSDGKKLTYSYYTEAPTYTTQNAVEYLSATPLNNKQDLIQILGNFANTNDYQTYMSGQGATDLNGYFAAMETINKNASSLDSVALSQLLSTGYTDDSFNSMLVSILGS